VVSAQVVVVKVLKDSQAQRLGLESGDFLLRYDGRPITQVEPFIRGRQAESKTDPPQSLVVQRKDHTITVKVSPGLLGAQLSDVASLAAAKVTPK
jgi:S1-C subfamily serine protease